MYIHIKYFHFNNDHRSMGDFKGLGLNVADHRDNAFIDDSPNVVQFWNSIGNFKPRVLQGFWK